MDTREGSFLLKHAFFYQNVIALKLDSTDNYVFFVNENKFDKELNCMEDVLQFLTVNYLTISQSSIAKCSKNFAISEDEQKEWMENIDKCPGCGFSSILNKPDCLVCGLHLD